MHPVDNVLLFSRFCFNTSLGKQPNPEPPGTPISSRALSEGMILFSAVYYGRSGNISNKPQTLDCPRSWAPRIPSGEFASGRMWQLWCDDCGQSWCCSTCQGRAGGTSPYITPELENWVSPVKSTPTEAGISCSGSHRLYQVLQSQEHLLMRVKLKISLRTSGIAAFATVSLLISAAPATSVALWSIEDQTNPGDKHKGLIAISISRRKMDGVGMMCTRRDS